VGVLGSSPPFSKKEGLNKFGSLNKVISLEKDLGEAF